jgi:hypothetical protein
MDNMHQFEMKSLTVTPKQIPNKSNVSYGKASKTADNTSVTQLLLMQSQLRSSQIDQEHKARKMQNDVLFQMAIIEPKRKISGLFRSKVEVKIRKLEAKFHEEKLTLQQKHDINVQKIIDRKNTEIEELKSHFRKKTKEAEETMNKLERRGMSRLLIDYQCRSIRLRCRRFQVQVSQKDLAVAKEEHEKVLFQTKKSLDDQLDRKQGDYEKKLNDTLNTCEHER